MSRLATSPRLYLFGGVKILGNNKIEIIALKASRIYHRCASGRNQKPDVPLLMAPPGIVSQSRFLDDDLDLLDDFIFVLSGLFLGIVKSYVLIVLVSMALGLHFFIGINNFLDQWMPYYIFF